MLSPNAETVLAKRYLAPNPTGGLETIPELFWRVATALAQGDREYGADDDEVKKTAARFYTLMFRQETEGHDVCDFLPNSPTLANAGARTNQLSACFVIPVPDSIEGIFDAVKYAALVHQTGGGTGFSFSRLRPSGDNVAGNSGISSGPLSFMDVFNTATESIKQGGMRRGANMAVLRVDHPDIIEFVRAKDDLRRLTNFNISVAITDVFMDAMAQDRQYDLVNPRSKEVVARLDARAVFNTIVEHAWRTGEPGLIFIDRMNRDCPVPWLGKYEAVNPCAEQPLLPYESCNLGSINLENFVTGDNQKDIDWSRLKQVVIDAVHLLDNVITVNRFPLRQLKNMSDETRKIGLGIMGFARLLFKLGVPYGSPEADALAEAIMSFIDYHSKEASVTLAIHRGSFPARIGHIEESNRFFDRICKARSVEPNRHPDCDYMALAERIHEHGIRHSNTTTIAPTGTLSIIANTSGGCEPVFGLVFKREQASTTMYDIDPCFSQAVHSFVAFGGQDPSAFLSAVESNHGSLVGLERRWVFPAQLAEVYVTAHDITPDAHIHAQAALQKYIDSAMSKTINFSESATPADVSRAYLQAWYTGCKGVTVYRNNSRVGQPLQHVVAEVKVEVDDRTCRMLADGFDPHCAPCVADWEALRVPLTE